MITHTAFYKFVAIDRPEELRERLRAACIARGLLGSIIIAPEGINGMLAGAEADILAWESALREDDRFSDIIVKRSECDEQPFARLSLKLKPEIVTMRVDVPGAGWP